MSKSPTSAPRLHAVVHIGPIKTGSTAFTVQMEASQERGELGESVVYALPRQVNRGDQSLIITPEHIRYLSPRLTWSRQTGDDLAPGSVKKEGSGELARLYLDNMVEELRSRVTSDTTVFFVEETISRRTGPGKLTVELLSRFESVTYVFVARAQHFIVPSAISQRIKMTGYPKVWDARVSSYLAKPHLAGQFDYAEILEKWQPDAPQVRLVAVPFLESDRGTQKLFYRILAAVGVSASLGAPVNRAVNATPSRFEIAALGVLKRVMLVITRDGLPHGGWRRAAYDAVKRGIARFASVIRSPRWSISPEDKAAIIEHYEDANSRFRDALGTVATTADWTAWFAELDQSPR
jgi:hypothetical protein